MDSFVDLAVKFTPYLLTGAIITLQLTFLSLTVSIPLGLIVAFMGLARSRIIHGIARFYVEIIRGTPALLQLFIVYFGLTSWGIRLNPIPAATLTLGVIGGAYVSEIFRAGIELWTAARSKRQERSACEIPRSCGGSCCRRRCSWCCRR